ncbi:hypothetical protein NLJ89_g5820 [Agrocybe chaxingu]|uniref:Uncharacterized protein n=1 Tax=Agrocybe chaxingu TaxID=84603 RepID=A0A9W8K028_9AGAR|nr:hypothetical protein NLJ89_g5820 [Agrocybe chaxingu]
MGSSNSIQAVPDEAGTLAVGTTPQTTAKGVQITAASTQSGSDQEKERTGHSDETQSTEQGHTGSPKPPSNKYKVHFPRWEGAVRDSVASKASTTTPDQSLSKDNESGLRMAAAEEGDPEATGARSSSATRNIAKTERKEGNEVTTTSHSGGGGIEGGPFGLERTRNVDHEDHEGDEADSNGSDDSGEESDDPDFPVWTGPRPCCHSHCVPRPRPK